MSERIYTRCPACGHDTLTINDDKHLLCTWIECEDPTLIDRIGEGDAALRVKISELEKEIAAHGSESWIEIQKTCSSLGMKMADIRLTLWPPTEGHAPACKEAIAIAKLMATQPSG